MSNANIISFFCEECGWEFIHLSEDIQNSKEAKKWYEEKTYHARKHRNLWIDNQKQIGNLIKDKENLGNKTSTLKEELSKKEKEIAEMALCISSQKSVISTLKQENIRLEEDGKRVTRFLQEKEIKVGELSSELEKYNSLMVENAPVGEYVKITYEKRSNGDFAFNISENRSMAFPNLLLCIGNRGIYGIGNTDYITVITEKDLNPEKELFILPSKVYRSKLHFLKGIYFFKFLSQLNSFKVIRIQDETLTF